MPSRDFHELVPELQDKYKLLVRMSYKAGIPIIITSGKRSLDEQTAYFFQGRKTLAEVNAQRKKAGLAVIEKKDNVKVTNTMFSAHLEGKAFDIAVLVNGKPSYDDALIPQYKKLGEIGEQIGLTWGGRWKKPDYPHFELKEDK